MNGDADDPAPHIQLIRKHGSGLYGEVWEGMDLVLNRKVAVKFIKLGHSHEANVLDHARALARVNHPNVVTIHQVTKKFHPEREELVDCAVMEWIDGETLLN